MSKCALQLECMRSNESVEGATGCHYTVHVWSLIGECGIHGRGRITTPGRFPYSFQEACEFFKVPHNGLVKDERLGQRLNIPTQGRRVAQTGTKPFSLTTPGSDPQPRMKPGPHWWETDVLTTQPPGHQPPQPPQPQCLCLPIHCAPKDTFFPDSVNFYIPHSKVTWLN